MNNDDFTVPVKGGGRHCWVSMWTVWPLHSKWLGEQSNESLSNFALSLNIPLQKLFGWFGRPQLWATGVWQLYHNNIPAHTSHLMQSILAKDQITQVTQPRYSPDLVSCNFWLFPKLKTSLKGKRFQTIEEIQENTMGQLMAIRRTCVRSQGAYFERDWGVIVLCTMFPVSWLFFSKCLYFSYYMARYLLDRPHGTEELW